MVMVILSSLLPRTAYKYALMNNSSTKRNMKKKKSGCGGIDLSPVVQSGRPLYRPLGQQAHTRGSATRKYLWP